MQSNESDRSVAAELLIDAPLAIVWARLADLPRWPRWSALYSRIEGEATPGSPLRVWIAEGSEHARDFAGRVVVVEAPTLLITEGGVPGQLYGRHTYRLAERGGQVLAAHEERFTGDLVDAVLAGSRELLLAEFRGFLADLKAACEADAAAP